MKKLFSIYLLAFLLFPIKSDARGIDQKLNEAFMPVADAWDAFVFTQITIGNIGIPIVLILLIGGASFFTIYFSFVNIRHFKTAIQVVRGKYDDLEKAPSEIVTVSVTDSGDIVDTIRDESNFGEVNHFQALTTAVSGTVGLGNIAMVAVAISIGGPGATFWMIVAGILGMSSKFVECTLGVKYRDIDPSGQVFGGPMYYLQKGLYEKGWESFGKILAVLFAVLCVGASFGGGNAFQSNQAAAQLITSLGLSTGSTGTILGILFALLVGIVIIGGIKRIARVTEKIVPIMAGLYVLAALIIILSNFSLIDDALYQIISEAFRPREMITGGFAGAMLQGFRRAAFSNEAGAGSAAIAHSAVLTKHPASEGLVALLEPFIDTVVVCTMTALVIILFNMQNSFVYGDVLNQEVLIDGARIGGVNLTSLAFDTALPGFSYIITIAVVLFAFSTMISWSYYGLQSWTYLFGRTKKSEMAFKLIFLLFTVLGAAVTLDAVSKFSNAMILALVFPNMIGLLILYPKVKEELVKYLTIIKAKGT